MYTKHNRYLHLQNINQVLVASNININYVCVEICNQHLQNLIMKNTNKEISNQIAAMMPLKRDEDGKLYYPLAFDDYQSFGLFLCNISESTALLNEFALLYGDGANFKLQDIANALSPLLDTTKQMTYETMGLLDGLQDSGFLPSK